MAKRFEEGFTMVELSLAIALISVLSLSIVLIILNTVSTFRRGMTLESVNTTGMEIVDDMRVAIQNSSIPSTSHECEATLTNGVAGCKSTDANQFTSVFKAGTVLINGTNYAGEGNDKIYGAFCTGNYSYIWNSGYLWEENSKVCDINNKNKDVCKKTSTPAATPASLTYNGNKTISGFRLLKVLDKERNICKQYFVSKNNYDTTMFRQGFDGKFKLSGELTEEPVELLRKEGSDALALYDFSVNKAGSLGNDNVFYSVSFILGTTRGGPNIRTSGKSCAVPRDTAVSALDYCSINKFNFAAQANGE